MGEEEGGEEDGGWVIGMGVAEATMGSICKSGYSAIIPEVDSEHAIVLSRMYQESNCEDWH